MQVASRVASAWSLIRERLSRRHLLLFLVLHAVTSTTLFVLSILSVETSAEASHLLRHLVDTADLSSLLFVNPHDGKIGSWRSAPALVVDDMRNAETDGEQGMYCDEGGKECKPLSSKQSNADQRGKNVQASSTSSGPEADTMTSTMTTSSNGVAVVTRVLIVPTVTVLNGEAIETQVMLNEAGDMVTMTPMSTLPSETSPAVSAVSTPTSSTLGANKEVEEEDEDDDEDEDEEEEEEEEEDDEDEDDDNDSVDSDDDGDDDEEEEAQRPAVLTVDKSVYIKAWKRDIELMPGVGQDLEVGVNVKGLKGNDQVFVSQQCAIHFGWSINSLDNLVREEIVLAAFFMWILGLAVVALLNESIPHLIALLSSLVLSSAWTANDLRVTHKFWSNFESMLDRHCGGIDVLPSYLTKRVAFQSTVLGLNVITLVVSALMCWRLRDHFGWQTFQRIGASTQINRLYKLVLALSILLQVDAFVLVTFFALFLDQISRGPALYFMRDCTLFQVIYSVLIVSLFPWLYFGWTSVRKEHRKQFNIFVALSVFLIAGWAISFANKVFRVVFTTWAFFTALGSLAAVLTILSIVLAIIRRTTFGQGLSEFLYLEEIHERPSEGFDEKPDTAVSVPGNTLPTFSTAFGPGPAPPRRMFPPMPAYFPGSNARASSAPSWRAGDDDRQM